MLRIEELRTSVCNRSMACEMSDEMHSFNDSGTKERDEGAGVFEGQLADAAADVDPETVVVQAGVYCMSPSYNSSMDAQMRLTTRGIT